MPETWSEDPERRRVAGVPEDVVFRTKPLIAAEQTRQAVADGVSRATVVADAAYGNDTKFRQALLDIAASSGSVHLVKVLADGSGDPNLVRKDGHTPFSVAVLAGDLPVVRELVERGAEVRGRWSPQDKNPNSVEAITLAGQGSVDPALGGDSG